MPGYISEVKYYGDSSEEFVEIALPAGTDPSGYVTIYMSDGTIYQSFPLGPSTGTMAGHDVYVIDASTPGFPTSDETGNFYPNDAIALVDGSGNVDQFISYEGNTVTATEGPANGLTSTNIGNINAVGQSMQSDDGGSTYYAQSSNNSGTIPACYAPGTLILTTTGPKNVEDLRVGDMLPSQNSGTQTIRWVWSGEQPLETAAPHQRPVLIQKNALGDGVPKQDLIVSGQHRIAVGIAGQLNTVFKTPCFVPAKSLTELPGIRFMNGKSTIVWHHFLCDTHALISANGTVSETLLLGSEVLQSLDRKQRAELAHSLDETRRVMPQITTALPCLSTNTARQRLINAPERRLQAAVAPMDDLTTCVNGRLASLHQPATTTPAELS